MGRQVWWRERVEPAQPRVLAFACVLAGSMALLTVAFPFSATAPTRFAACLVLVAWSLAAGLWWRRSGMPRWMIDAVVVAATASVSACVAASTTEAGPAVTAFAYLWVALYPAWFHGQRAALAHLALIGLGLGVGLELSDAPSAVQTWLFVMACTAGVAQVLNRLVRTLRSVAERDDLTGLPNRPAFATAVQSAAAIATRRGWPLSLAVIDLDGFKLVNDQFGHAAGDRLLRELAETWQRTLRPEDVLGRYGGDEFVLLMPDTTPAQASRLLGRLAGAHSAAWSAGVAAWQGDDLDAWLGRADDDLYLRKADRSATSSDPSARATLGPWTTCADGGR